MLAVVTAAVYGSSFGGVFVFDDVQWIVENEAIRQVWPPWRAAGGTLRPVLFWSLALNYAVSGLETWSYHAVNLLIHVGAALTLFGVLRRGLAGRARAEGPAVVGDSGQVEAGPALGASPVGQESGGQAAPAGGAGDGAGTPVRQEAGGKAARASAGSATASGPATGTGPEPDEESGAASGATGGSASSPDSERAARTGPGGSASSLDSERAAGTDADSRVSKGPTSASEAKPTGGPRADALAFAAALIWAVHPLQTQAVTYTIQRGESLTGLLLLLVLYCTHRGAASPARPTAWYVAAAAALYAGLGTKEVMVAALPVLWVWDRLFLAGSFRAALAARRWLYAALAGPLISGGALALLFRPEFVAGLLRGDAVDVTRWEYAWSQPGVLFHYLRLCVWPFPQYLDYGWAPAGSWVGIVLPGLVIVGLAAASAWSVRRGDRLGFAGAWFFLLLAPTSSLVPLKDLLVEHRMYLPLAAVVTLAVLAVGELVRRLEGRGWRGRGAGALILAVAALSLGAATWRRNLDYHSELGVWGGAAADRAGNVKRYYNLGLEFLLEDRGLLEPATFAVSVDTAGLSAAGRQGVALLQAGEMAAAGAAFERALSADPDDVASLTGAGIARFLGGDVSGARRWLARVAQLQPGDGAAHTNLSCALLAAGDTTAAVTHAVRAAALAPHLAEARHNAGTVRALAGQWREARGHLEEARLHLEEALRLRPGFAAARNNLGAVLAADGDREGALAAYEAAARQGSRTARVNAGLLLLDLRRPNQAAGHLRQASDPGPHRQLAAKGLCVAAYTRGQLDKALEPGQLAVHLDPQDPEAHNNLANCYLALGHAEQALEYYRGALILDPRRVAVHHNLARALFALGSPGEAAGHLERALALRPTDEALRADLAAARGAAGQ